MRNPPINAVTLIDFLALGHALQLRASGPFCKGASAEMKAISAEERAFYTTLKENYERQFANQEFVLSSIRTAWLPILNLGIGQKGFTPAEETAMRTEATEGTADEYQKSAKAVNESLAQRGGGTAFLPSGGAEQIRAEIAQASAAEQARKNLAITEANYAQGRQNFQNATAALAGNAALMNPVSYAGAATTASAGAFQSAQAVYEANLRASPWSAIGGALGGALGTAFGGPGGGELGYKAGTALGGCWIAEAIYGVDDPRTNLVRWYLNTIWATQPLGKIVMALYVRFGRTVASWVRQNLILRAILRPLFDVALASAERARSRFVPCRSIV